MKNTITSQEDYGIIVMKKRRVKAAKRKGRIMVHKRTAMEDLTVLPRRTQSVVISQNFLKFRTATSLARILTKNAKKRLIQVTPVNQTHPSTPLLFPSNARNY